MKVLKFLVFGLIGLVALVLIASMMMSNEMYVEREAVIDAPVEVVYAHLATPKLRSQWDPWLAEDPNVEITFEGPESGVGAINRWNSQEAGVGVGSQEIVEARENEYIQTRVTMDMMEDEIKSEFNLEPTEDGKTKIKWTMNSESTGWGPFNGIMSSMGQVMVGASFDQGLMNIASLMTEVDHSQFTQKAPDFAFQEMAPIHYVGIEGESETNSEAIAAAMGQSYGAIMGYMGEQGINPAGMPFVISKKWSPETNEYEFIAGMPTQELHKSTNEAMIAQTWPGGMMGTAIHYGKYDNLSATYEALEKYIAENGYEIIGMPIEQYMNDPGDTAEKDLQTLLAFPVKKKA